MNPVDTGLTLLLAIATALSNGLKAYQDTRYDEAVKQLTVVVEKADAGGDQWFAARFYRAKSLIELEKKDEAKKDLGELLKWPGKQDIRKDALKLYLAMDGKEADFLPKDGPKKVALGYLDLTQKRNYDAALRLCTGAVKRTLQASRKAAALRGNLAGNVNVNVVHNVKRTIIGDGKYFGKAWVLIVPNWGGRNGNLSYVNYYELELFPKTGEWKVATQWYQLQQKNDGDDGGIKKGAENVDFNREMNLSDLQRLGVALLSHAETHDGAFPKSLDLLKTTSDDDDDPLKEEEDGSKYLWTHPFSGAETLQYLYRPGLKKTDPNPGITLLLAGPDAYDGKRSVLYASGANELIAEAEFQRLAKAQGWKVADAKMEFPGSDELEKKANALIKQLGADDFKERRAAKKALKELGKAIVPVLERHLKSKDPEIRETIKTLIESM